MPDSVSSDGLLEQLQHKIQEYQAIFNSVGDGLVVVDLNRVITASNNQVEYILGWKSYELVGQDYQQVVPLFDSHGQLVDFDHRPIRLALAGQKISEECYFFQTKDGRKIPVSLIATPIVQNGKVTGAVNAFRDITKEKESEKAKDDFLALASHQLRTPLTTISWYTEMLSNPKFGSLNANQQKYLQSVASGNKRMINLVNALLNVSRIELGKFHSQADVKQVSVIEIAQQALEDLAGLCLQHRVNIKTEFDLSLPPIQIDPKQLRMVFENLLSNAVRYTKSGDQVMFRLKLDTAKTHLIGEVEDHGYGIPLEQQSKIFTKLFRADNIVTLDTEGTGLGLFITKSIIKEAKGQINFVSEPNKGTIFRFTLPL